MCERKWIMLPDICECLIYSNFIAHLVIFVISAAKEMKICTHGQKTTIIHYTVIMSFGSHLIINTFSARNHIITYRIFLSKGTHVWTLMEFMSTFTTRSDLSGCDDLLFEEVFLTLVVKFRLWPIWNVISSKDSPGYSCHLLLWKLFSYTLIPVPAVIAMTTWLTRLLLLLGWCRRNPEEWKKIK